MHSAIDFGYPWFLNYGHLPLLAVGAALWLLGRARQWPKLPMVLIGAFAVWSLAAFLVARFVIDFNSRGTLPTQHFLTSRTGRVLDMGAGTGRSSLMVLEARPQATLVALDLFTESYERHFGRGMNGQERLLANFKAAGVEKRATVQAGDMRQLPFEAAAFDAVVSAYAIDHLNRDGITTSLHEASRVLRPGGDFLLMVVGKEFWANFAFGPLLAHGGTRSAEYWSSLLDDAGFQVVEHGTRPLTLYLLARKR